MKARDRLVTSAIDLIRRNGVAGTGLSLLLELSGTARRSLYLNFPGGKAELVADATLAAGRYTGDAIDQLAATLGPVPAVRAFVAAWRDTLTDSDFLSGCPIVAAALGRSEADKAADNAGAVFLDWQRRLAGHLEAADVSAEDAARLAGVTVSAVEGAIVVCQATKSTEPLQHVEDALIELYALKVAATASGSDPAP
ncbi:TetR/AcrR family transcriptional regulator [Mycolicibacterium sp. P9-22]|uniref:TetR/AcrR family transcriptional regulator n=1 Tax=Mycolicibacterium sp. P9-22 TaxID=2024613 RepID=UPI0011ED2C3B|nr:TetR family transcriptional regulator [Mycolicibacterium sp. P9-22]KAA0120452.1 TetR family transcriptional regulator [Mycolicibacterium sp. P9-22]